MPSILIPAVVILFLVASASAALLTRDVVGARLRERVGAIGSSRHDEQDTSNPVRAIVLRPTSSRSKHFARLMDFLRFNPEISAQNVIAWKLVLAIASIVAVFGFFYGRAFLGWPLALLVAPI